LHTSHADSEIRGIMASCQKERAASLISRNAPAELLNVPLGSI
jgi:hypothetical protein